MENFNIGDKVYCNYHHLHGVVSSINNHPIYPINVIFSTYDTCLYTEDGRYLPVDPTPSLSKVESQFPRVMEVRDSNSEWVKRVVIAFKQGYYIAWIHAETFEEAEKETQTTTWQQAREIQEFQVIEVTLEEIAKLKGCSVEQLRIKD